MWLEELGLGLGLWQGNHKRIDRLWLRFYDDSLNWIPTSTEREEQERQRAERFRRLLIENGINPDEA